LIRYVVILTIFYPNFDMGQSSNIIADDYKLDEVLSEFLRR